MNPPDGSGLEIYAGSTFRGAVSERFEYIITVTSSTISRSDALNTLPVSERESRNGPVAVSYTHLTLPTSSE
ncbi:MAG: hypothetical protein QUS66_15460, partial [Bacteroidota bacterium]|nr:hypothetical protein [Bacteroidota bacterium]